MRAKYEAQGVGFLAVAADPDLDEVTQAAARYGLRFAVASATNELLVPFRARQVPDTIYVDAQGKVVAFDSGPRNQEQFEERVKQLVAQK